jgi:Flp pilus assembly protein CpaB
MELTQGRPVGSSWRRLPSTRRGTLAIALVSALIAAGILVIALHSYRKSVETSGTPATVLVATRAIEQGTSGQAIAAGQFFKPTRILAKQITTGALADPGALRGKVAAANIYPGEQLTAADFVTRGGIVSKLGSGQRAIAVPLDNSHGLVGSLQAGEHVDVYASFQSKSATEVPFLRLLAPNVVVLKAGEASGAAGLGASNQPTAVLAVSAHQATDLAFAVDNGKVWLTLRPGNAAPTSRETVNEASIRAGHAPASKEGNR